jgi:putative membrane protein (TIGR04086 family)
MWWTGRRMGMVGGSRETRTVDFAAIVRGALWGFLFFAAVALGIALLGPLVPSVQSFIEMHDAQVRWVVYGVGGLLAGYAAGARAGSMGFVHGALAALGSTLLLAVVSGILSGTPNAGEFAMRAAVNVAMGGLGGIMGANVGR